MRLASRAYLWWFIFLAGVLWLFLSDILPVKFTFVQPANLYYCFVEAEIFFVLLLLPILIPKILETKTPSGTLLADIPVMVIQLAVFFILALPLGIIALNLGNMGWQALAKGQLFVFALASVVAAIFTQAIKKGKEVTYLYYFVAFILSAGAPFLYYILREYEGKDLAALPLLSPFWSSLIIIG